MFHKDGALDNNQILFINSIIRIVMKIYLLIFIKVKGELRREN